MKTNKYVNWMRTMRSPFTTRKNIRPINSIRSVAIRNSNWFHWIYCRVMDVGGLVWTMGHVQWQLMSNRERDRKTDAKHSHGIFPNQEISTAGAEQKKRKEIFALLAASVAFAWNRQGSNQKQWHQQIFFRIFWSIFFLFGRRFSSRKYQTTY